MVSSKDGLVFLVPLKSPQWITIHEGDFIVLNLKCMGLGRSFPFSFQITCKKKNYNNFFKSNSITILYNVKYVYYIRYNVQILLHQ
jgi:hypothetical protein